MSCSNNGEKPDKTGSFLGSWLQGQLRDTREPDCLPVILSAMVGELQQEGVTDAQLHAAWNHDENAECSAWLKLAGTVVDQLA